MGLRGRLIGIPPGECLLCAPDTGVVWDGNALLEGRASIGDGCGDFSLESEHDLAALVTDFLENGSSSGDSYWGSTDSDNGFSDLGFLAEKISVSVLFIYLFFFFSFLYLILFLKYNLQVLPFCHACLIISASYMNEYPLVLSRPLFII